MTIRDVKLYLQDIGDSISKINKYTIDLDFESFIGVLMRIFCGKQLKMTCLFLRNKSQK